MAWVIACFCGKVFKGSAPSVCPNCNRPVETVLTGDPEMN